MAEQTHEQVQFEKAAGMLRVQGILSIVFGGLGAFFSLLLLVGITLGSLSPGSEMDPVSGFILSFITLVFVVIPHIYLIIAGTQLLSRPTPKAVRVLTIINLIVGVLWNWVIGAFAIVNLVQLQDYERGFTKHAR